MALIAAIGVLYVVVGIPTVILPPIDWTQVVSTFVAGAVPATVAVYLALTERRGARRDREDDHSARQRDREEDRSARRDERSQDRNRDRALYNARRADDERDRRYEAAVAILPALDLLRAAAEIESAEHRAVQASKAVEAFAYAAVRMHFLEPDPTDMWTRLMVAEAGERYLELTTGRPMALQWEWVLEFRDAPSLIAGLAWRLDLWVRGIPGSSLANSTSYLIREHNLIGAEAAAGWLAPYVYGVNRPG